MPSRERRLLDKDKEIRKLKGTAGHYFTCTINSAIENEKLKQELDRTKKKLDIAVDALKYANKCIKGGCVNWETEIDKALKQINEITKGRKDDVV